MTDNAMVFAPAVCALCTLSNRPAVRNPQYSQAQPKQISLRQQAAARLQPPVDPAQFRHLSTAELCKLSKRQNKAMEQIVRERHDNQVKPETRVSPQNITGGDGSAPQTDSEQVIHSPASGNRSSSVGQQLLAKAKAAIDKKYDAKRARAEFKYKAKCERIEMDHGDAQSPVRRAKQIKLDERHNKKMTKIDLKNKKKVQETETEAKRNLPERCTSTVRQIFSSNYRKEDGKKA